MVWQSGDAVRSGSEFRNWALFWFGSVSIGWLQMIIIARGVRASFGIDKYPGWALLLASALIGAVPLTFQVRWLVEVIIAPTAGLPAPWVTYLNVFVINTVFSLIQYMLIERWPLFQLDDAHGTPASIAAAEDTDSRPTVGMLRRRPDGLNGVIRYLQMEDHYLHVHTDEGSGLTLHRMSDAIEDLAASDGLQVHKSWWVSFAAIDEIVSENRKKTVITHDGVSIPVGRSFEKSLRAAGWI
ncbi:MAG: LytTR family DNA-binding domain-containing protein [Boseongicola sp.]